MTDIVERLHLLQSGAAWYCEETSATLEDAADEIERLRAERDEARAYFSRLLQIKHPTVEPLPDLLGVCTQIDNALAGLLAERNRAMANGSIDRGLWLECYDACQRAEAERDEAIQRGDDWCDQAQKLRAERDRLRAGLLRALQYENKCDQTGQPCDASDRCACSLEAETWCDGDGA
jgi:hypothetical protein